MEEAAPRATARADTVFEGSAYVGDARVLNVQPNEERPVSYAIDLGTEVDPKAGLGAQRTTSVKAVKGVVATVTKLTEEKTYVRRLALLAGVGVDQVLLPLLEVGAAGRPALGRGHDRLRLHFPLPPLLDLKDIGSPCAAGTDAGRRRTALLLFRPHGAGQTRYSGAVGPTGWFE